MMRRLGFTLVELIIVILLLGILGVMSTDIISQSYRNYVYQKEVADLQARSKQLLDQLGAYLDRAIKPSIARLHGADHESIWGLGVTDAEQGEGNYLEWIGKDTESMQGIWVDAEQRVYPGYSGLANVRDSGGTAIVTTDCDLDHVDTVQGSITGEPTIADGGNWQRAALYFVYANSDGSVQGRFWDTPTSLFGISGYDAGNGIIQLADTPGEIGERYYLSYTAYGIQREADGTLYLYHNFRPWNGESVLQGTQRKLMENVVSFEYWSESDNTILRFKVCLSAENDPQTTFCKEGVVLR